MEYVTFDPDTGALTGGYTAQEPAEGENFIEVGPEQRANWTLYQANSERNGLELLPPVVPAPLPRHITGFAFRERFTHDEKVRIDLASIDNPAAPLAERKLSASIRVMLADIAAARRVDLDMPKTRVGVETLEAAGLLDGEGRALEILDAEIVDDERA